MLTLTQITDHKSIKSLSSINLPDFTIITGINGSGKTQLLEAIVERKLQIKQGDTSLGKIRFFNSQNFNFGADSFDYDSLEGNTQDIYEKYREIRNKISDLPSGEKIDFERKYIKIAEMAKKDIYQLTDKEFKAFPIISDTDVFSHNLSKLFYCYAYTYENIRYRNYKSELPYDEDDIINQLGTPPWEVMNDMLKMANLEYRVNYPNLKDFDHESNFTINLTNTTLGGTINFKDLSSGEKVIMSFVLTLFNSDLKLSFPEVLLLDEIDASLHPSMTRQLISILQGFFVEEHNVKVILTTHSISKVALASEESIFVMNKAEPRIEKVNKEYAVPLLSDGFIAISEDLILKTENKKTLFVEGNDAKYYSNLRATTLQNESGANKSDIYYKIKLVEASFGLIDRDFLTDDEIGLIRKCYPKLFVLHYY